MKEHFGKNIALVGIGPLSKRVYLEFFKKFDCDLKLVIDLKCNRKHIESVLNDMGYFGFEFIGAEEENKDDYLLSDQLQTKIKKAVFESKIKYVVIATEPKAHYAYAKLFLTLDVDILLEKPTVAVRDVINDNKALNRLLFEAEDLVGSYTNRNNKFCVMTQRRYHKGYILARQIIDEVISKYNVGISSVTVNSCDGMWNMPNELSREYHPYKYGYGKLFHSGYHHVDLLLYYMAANNALKNKEIDSVDVFSSAYYPRDFLNNIRSDDYFSIFNERRYDTTVYETDGYGELDIHSLIEFKSGGFTNAIANINLLQSGFSRRSWMDLPEDVYKGNGRIKHEFIDIAVGPLLSVKLMSFQSKLKSENNDGTKIGDNDHFEIHVYRNSALIGGEPVRIIKIDDIIQKDSECEDYNIQAREQLFLDFLNGDGRRSNYLTHYATMKLISQMYRSLAEDKKTSCRFKPYELPREKGLLIADSEGTVKKNGDLLPGVVNEIERLRENNIIPVLATGLPLYIAKAIGAKIDAKYVIAAGGAQIYDAEARKTLYYRALDKYAVDYIMSNKPKFADLAITCKDANYTTNINEAVSEIVKYVPENKIDSLTDICHIRFRIHQLNARDNMEEALSLTLKEARSLSYGGGVRANDIALCRRALADYESDKFGFLELYKVVQTVALNRFKTKMLLDLKGVINLHNESSNFEKFDSDDEITWFTIVNGDVGKGEAVGILKDYLCLERGEKVIAVGNAYNDLSMMEIADMPIYLGDDCSVEKCLVIKQDELSGFLKRINLILASNGGMKGVSAFFEKSRASKNAFFDLTSGSRKIEKRIE